MGKGSSGPPGVSGDEAVVVPPSSQSGPFQRLRRGPAAPVTPPSAKRKSAAHNRISARGRIYYAKLVTTATTIIIMMCILYNSIGSIITVPNVKIVPVQPVQVESGKANPIALIMPLVGYPLSNSTGVELLRELLQPLLLSEAALCYRAADGAAVPVAAHAVVVSRVSATAVRSAVRGVLAKGSTTAGSAVAATEAGGSLTSGARWRTWEVSAASVRSALRLANASDGRGARCLAEAVTVVAHAVEDGGAIYGTEPAETLEVLVDAGLRTRGGGAGTHFVVLPSFLGASRMAHTEPDDASEARRAGTGLLDALLRTATTRNGGRVAAAQCTILATAEQPGSPSLLPPGLVPAELSRHDLQRLQVLEKAAIVGSTNDDTMLVPFLARRFSGYLATDQRATWEEVVDAVSLNCGIFSRSLYNAVGGLAGALSVSGAQHPSSTLPDHVLAAPDRGGWALSLRMQEVYPDWQVWSSRGVAVLRDDLTAGRSSPIVQSLFSALFSLRDAYGRRMHPLLAGLQRRRVGQPWRTRQKQLRMWNSTAVPSHFPAVISYETDFIAPCCGLNREAMGYIRPLMERYAIRTLYATQVCHKPGDALLDAAYRTRHYNRVLSVPVDPQADDSYWHEELKRRARVLFLHMRPISRKTVHFTNHSSVVSVKIARSLSELSNIPPNWIKPLRKARDQVWATADFFATIYRRNGIAPAKVRVVPEAVDVYDFDPANYEREPITIPPGDTASFDSLPDLTPEERLRRYVFLSNFKWEDRKGWDVLLGAYWDAFGPHAPPELRGRTTLVIKAKFQAPFARGVTCSNVLQFIESWGMMGHLHGMQEVEDFPHVVLLCTSMNAAQLTQLYASADAFVFPSKAEGWGLPATEAMSMGLPVLLTEWSGLRGFITPDTCFRIPLDGLEEIAPDSPYRYKEGMKMAVPSREKTAELMRYVLQHPEHARRVGQRARALMMREMSEEAVADTMDSLFIDTVTARLKRL